MIKTFHVATNSQVANIFTKALGFSSFVRLLEKLGLKDIFQPKLLKEQSKQLQVASLVQVSEPNTLDLRGSVEDYQSCESYQKRRKGTKQKKKKEKRSLR